MFSDPDHIHRTPPKVITPPAAEPNSLAEVKAHMRRSSGTSEDDLITMYIKSCRKTLERMLGMAFLNTVFEERLDAFPCSSDEPVSPYISDVSAIGFLKYIDTTGILTTLVENTDFVVDYSSKRARIVPAYGHIWPVTRLQPNAVQMQYTAGHGTDPNALDEDLKTMHLLAVTMAYTERLPISALAGNDVPAGFGQIVSNFTNWSF